MTVDIESEASTSMILKNLTPRLPEVNCRGARQRPRAKCKTTRQTCPEPKGPSPKETRKQTYENHHSERVLRDGLISPIASDKGHSMSSFGQVSQAATDDRCLEHGKELDMVCCEARCLRPVCSNCILFGEHKNHDYIKIETFWERVRAANRQLAETRTNIHRRAQDVTTWHTMSALKARLDEYRNRLEQRVQRFYEDLISKIQKRKQHVLCETKYHFQEVECRLAKYCQEAVHWVGVNKDWSRSVCALFEDPSQDWRQVAEAFKFLGQVETDQVVVKGQRLLEKFKEMKVTLDRKMARALDSFRVECKDVGSECFKITKKNVTFSTKFETRIDKIMSRNMTRSIEIYSDSDLLEGEHTASDIGCASPKEGEARPGSKNMLYGASKRKGVQSQIVGFNLKGGGHSRVPLAEFRANSMKSYQVLPVTMQSQIRPNKIMSFTNIGSEMRMPRIGELGPKGRTGRGGGAC